MKTVDKARLAFGRTGAAGSSALRGPRAIARLRTSALFWRGPEITPWIAPGLPHVTLDLLQQMKERRFLGCGWGGRSSLVFLI